jgi:hypothetical protein
MRREYGDGMTTVKNKAGCRWTVKNLNFAYFAGKLYVAVTKNFFKRKERKARRKIHKKKEERVLCKKN